MAGIKRNASVSNPCPICGGTDWCCSYDYGQDGILIWCARSDSDAPVVAGGAQYDYIATKEVSSGVFHLYKEHSQNMASKERWKEKQRKINPNWKPEQGKKLARYESREGSPAVRSTPQKIEGYVEAKDHATLDRIYRRMLSLLILEKRHKDLLLQEWESAVYPDLGNRLLSRYPIRSLPPDDKVRYSPQQKGLHNGKSRKEICQTLLREFGDLTGVPGFFKRGGEYWTSKPEEERWTFASIEGIVFPVYDEDGFLYRIRIRDDYPDVEVKRGEKFEGKEGAFHHTYGKDGEHLWYFIEKGSKIKTLVYSPAQKKIELKKGIPHGKTSGKYKNFASEVLAKGKEGNQIFNIREGGCASGIALSLYVPEKPDYRVVIATEGEKKAMVASDIKNVPVISVPGVSSYGKIFEETGGKSLASHLKEKGTKAMILCYDADKNENQRVSDAESRFVETAKKFGFKTYLGEWSDRFNKGIDDILIMGLDFRLKPV